jgi:uncharacterized YigZ family protein
VSRTAYLTIARDGSAEIEVDRSRFLCTLVRVADESLARATTDAARKAHWDARHHCSAFRIGPEGEIERSNDDGEPSGTAGAPMLAVLRGREVSDVVAVVTRWFGGVLLGTGGLARAYADAVRTALDEVGTLERRLLEDCSVRIDHAGVGRLQHDLRSRGLTVVGVAYEDQAILRLATPPDAHARTVNLLAELTAGEGVVSWNGKLWVDAP